MRTTAYGSAILSFNVSRKWSSAVCVMVRVLPNHLRSGWIRPGVTSDDWNSAALMTLPSASRIALLDLPDSKLTRRADLASR